MERRSVAMATRRAARLERVSARERDRKEAQAQQEVDRQEAELAAKRQREAVRRAEKQAAKQVRGAWLDWIIGGTLPGTKKIIFQYFVIFIFSEN